MSRAGRLDEAREIINSSKVVLKGQLTIAVHSGGREDGERFCLFGFDSFSSFLLFYVTKAHLGITGVGERCV